MRKLLATILLLMFLVPAALAEDEDFSIFDLIDDEVILDEEENTEASVYEPDGSVLLTLTFTGDFTIGKSTGTDRFDYFGA